MARREKQDPVATDCCQLPDPRIARRFDEMAGAYTDTDEFPAMVDVSARLLDQLRDTSTLRPTVLELGCGTGALSLALLEMGASRVTGVDLSQGAIGIAKRRVAAGGFAAQADFVVGDAASVPLGRHDWVVLDRAICCFRHSQRLVANAISAGASRVAISVPESRGWRG
ncbi:MAG: methyltransferase domain-containing protein, partial [Candidatus Limnocylindria bacterium]